jgi:hypothetical protein
MGKNVLLHYFAMSLVFFKIVSFTFCIKKETELNYPKCSLRGTKKVLKSCIIKKHR